MDFFYIINLFAVVAHVLCIYIYLHVRQTAGQNWLSFFEGTNKLEFFLQNLFFKNRDFFPDSIFYFYGQRRVH